MRARRLAFLFLLVLFVSAGFHVSSPPQIKLLDLNAPGVTWDGHAKYVTGPTFEQAVFAMTGHLGDVENAEDNPCFGKRSLDRRDDTAVTDFAPGAANSFKLNDLGAESRLEHVGVADLVKRKGAGVEG
jgi:hypothetical protein